MSDTSRYFTYDSLLSLPVSHLLTHFLFLDYNKILLQCWASVFWREREREREGEGGTKLHFQYQLTSCGRTMPAALL